MKKTLSVLLALALVVTTFSNSGIFTASATTINTQQVVSIAGGWAHTLAIKEDGTVWSWGHNSSGQLGIDSAGGNYYEFDSFDRSTPVQVVGITNAVAVAGGDHHSLVLKSDGTVWSFGSSCFGQLGVGKSGGDEYAYDDEIDSKTPVQVNGLSDITSISSDNNSCIALRSDGTVWVWGETIYGNVSLPVQVIELNSITKIVCGHKFYLALQSNGTIMSWGNNNFGQLGDNTSVNKLNPVQVLNLTNVVDIAAGWSISRAIKNDGTVWCWGKDEWGNLDYQINNSPIPVSIDDFDNAVDITANSNFTLITKSDKSVWVFGRNYTGELGMGTMDDSPLPTRIESLDTNQVSDIAAGGISGIALYKDGTLRTWGDNWCGQLGIGTAGGHCGYAYDSSVDELSPVQVPNFSGVMQPGTTAHDVTFGIATEYGDDSPAFRDVKVKDFNNDGYMDFACICYSGNNTPGISNKFIVYLGNGTGTFIRKASYTVGTTPWRMTIADFNNDGVLDAATANANSSDISVLIGVGDGTFNQSVQFSAGYKPCGIVSADFNLDGIIDLAVSNNESNYISLLFGDGSGVFTRSADTYNVGSLSTDMATGDFNKDDIVDIVVANNGSPYISVLIGKNDDTFQSSVSYNAGSFPCGVVVVDINNDTIADILVANVHSDNVSVLLGNVDGTFNNAVNYPAGSGAASLVTADFNNDEKIDIAVTNYFGNNVSVLLGNSNGTFQTASNYFNQISVQSAIATGDFNCDKYEDLIIASYGSVKVYLQSPSGIPMMPTNLTSPKKTNTTVDLSWSASAGATGYNVYSSSTKLNSTPITTTTYTATGLTQNTAYTFTVKAVNAAGESAASEPLSVTTDLKPTAPLAPTGLTSTGKTDTTVSLSWIASADTTGYNVYRGAVKLNATPITETSYLAAGLTQNTAYSFAVTAVNAVGQSPASDTLYVTTNPASTPPQAPTGLNIPGKTDTTVNLSWSVSAGATGYNVYNGAVKLTATPITATNYTVSGLTQNTAYTFTVTAVNTAGESLASTPLVVTTNPTIPGQVQFTVSSVTGKAGDTVTVSINISPDSQMSAGTFELPFNPALLEYVSAVKGPALVTGTTDIYYDVDNNKVVMGYFNIDPMNTAGSILDIQFKIKTGTLNQAINMNISVLELADANRVNLPYAVTQGVINVVNIILGDVNDNGQITAVDALMALQATTGKLKLTAAQKFAADVNKDGKVGSIDALQIMQFVSGRITSFS